MLELLSKTKHKLAHETQLILFEEALCESDIRRTVVLTCVHLPCWCGTTHTPVVDCRAAFWHRALESVAPTS